MGRRAADKNVKRDNKGRILPPNVTQRSDGRYLWRWTYKGNSYLLYNVNLADLKVAIELEKADIIRRGCSSMPEDMLLNDAFLAWIKIKENSIRTVTINNYTQYWSWYIRDGLGKRKISKITREMVRKCYEKLLTKTGLSRSTLHMVNNILFQVLEYQYRERNIDRNPVHKVISEVGGDEKTATGKFALSPEQQATFLDYVKEHRYYRENYELLYILFNTGLRAGEACALTRADIDMKNSVIYVNKSLSYRASAEGKREKHIGDAKTALAKRMIPMSEGVKAAFVKLMEKQDMIRTLDVKPEVIDGYKGFIFTTERGTVQTVDYLTLKIKKIVNSYNKREKELSKKEKRDEVQLPMFTAHICRHTFITRCKEKKMDRDVLRAVVGHVSDKTTDIYTHMRPEILLEEMKVLELA